MGDSMLNGVMEKNLSNDRSFKCRKSPRATVNDLQHHALAIIRKQPNILFIHAGTNDVVKFTSRDILKKLLQLNFFIKEKLPMQK